MKVFRFYAPGDVRIEDDYPEPVAGPDEVKIRVRACSMCGTDVKIATSGHQRMRPPRVMGHEIAGEIVQVGDGVTGWQAGDRVQVIAAIPCGTCEFCTSGLQTICPNQLSMGYDFDGGFAPYMVVPREVLAVDGLNRIPDGVSFAEASVSEPFACAINAQELVNTHEGDVVVVVGSGPIGCLHVRLARARGASEVYLVELSRERLDLAAQIVKPDAAICSAETDPVQAVLDLTAGKGVSLAITAAASGAAQEQALRMLAPRGPDLPVRRPAQGPADDHPGLEPRALPRAVDLGRQRLEPCPQQAGARAHRRRQRARGGPHHSPAAAGPDPRRPRHRPCRHGHQGHDRAVRP